MATIEELLSGEPDNIEEQETVASPESTTSLAGGIDSLLGDDPIDSEPEDKNDRTSYDYMPFEEPAAEDKPGYVDPQTKRADEFNRAKFEATKDEGFLKTIWRSLSGSQYGTENVDDIENLPKVGRAIEATYESAENSMELGRLYHKVKLGTASAGDQARAKELEATNIKLGQEAQDTPYMAESMATLAPFLKNSMVKGGKGYLYGYMFGAGVAGVLGQTPGLSVLPEELVTAPALGAAGGKIGASFAAVSDIAEIEGGLAFKEFTDLGMDKQKAAIASDFVGTGSGLLELAQFRMLKRLIPNGGKAVNGIMKDAVMKSMSNFTKTVAGESSVETLQELWKNIAQLAAQNIRNEFDEKDLSAKDFEDVQRVLTSGLVETFAQTATGFAGFGIPTAAVNVATGINVTPSDTAPKDGNTTTPAESGKAGVRVNTPDTSRETDVRSEAHRPHSVESLLGVEGEDTKLPDGVSISGETNITDEQRTMQHQGVDAYKQVLGELAGEKAMAKFGQDITNSEARLQNLVGFYNDAVTDEDAQGALQVAQMMDEQTQAIVKGYEGLMNAAQVRAKNKDMMPNPENVIKVQAEVERLQAQSQERIKQQTTNVQQIQQQAQQAQIDKMETDSGLHDELVGASVQANRDGKPKVARLYNNVIGEIKLRESMGTFEYFKNTPMKKLVNLKVEAELNREEQKGQPNQDVFTLARDQQIDRWINQQIDGRIEYDQIQLAGERFTHEEGKAQRAEQQAKETERAKPAVEAVRAKEATAKQERVAKEEKARAETVRKVEKGKRTVSDLRKTLAKPAVGPTRTVELEEAKEAKARRVAEIKKLRAQNPDLEDSPAKKVVKQDIGSLKNEDIAKMSFKDRARAVLGEEASNEEVTVLAKQAEKVAKDLEKKSKIDDTILQDIDAKSVEVAKQLFRGTALQYKGKLYEGTSHIGIIMENKVLEDAINSNKDVADGFVQHDGTFVSREAATKLVGKKDGEQLYSEDFINQALADAASRKLSNVPPRHKPITFSITKPDGRAYGLTVDAWTEAQAVKMIDDILTGNWPGRTKYPKGIDSYTVKAIERDGGAKNIGAKRTSRTSPRHHIEHRKYDYPEPKVITVQSAIDTQQAPVQELQKQNVLQAINKADSNFVKLAKKLIKKADVTVSVVADIDSVPNWSKAVKDIIKVSRAVYMGSTGQIVMNAKALSTKSPQQIQNTFLHEALHAVMAKTYREVKPDTYRRGMRKIHNWYNASLPAMQETLDRQGGVLDPRVRSFLSVMKVANDTVKQADKDMMDGAITTEQLTVKMIKYEEALTYPFVSPAVAKFLNSTEAPASVKTSKIKTLWDHLVNTMLTAFGIPVRTGSSLAQLTDIANEVFNIAKDRGEVRFSLNGATRRWRAPMKKYLDFINSNPGATKAQIKDGTGLSQHEIDNLTDLLNENRASITDDLDFSFGANVDKATVESWATEMSALAKNALDVVVTEDHAQLSEVLGFEAHPGARAIWHNIDGKSTILFNAEAFQSQEDFVEAWMHEQVAHQGLRNVFGKNTALFNRFLDQAYTLFVTSNAKQVFEMAELYKIGVDPKTGEQNTNFTKAQKRELAEEMIALKAEKMKPVVKKGLLARFKKFLNSWLPKRFTDVKSTFKMTDDSIMDMLRAARENVLTGNNEFGQLLTSKMEERVPQHKSEAWKNIPAFIESDETYLEWAKAVKDKAPNLQKWYSEHTETISQNFGKDTDLFNVLLAITSPQADVETNVQFAVDTYAYMMGLRDKPGALFPNVLKKRIDTHWTNPSSMLANLDSKNFKVTEFTRALLGDPDATVGDLWMYRAFYGDPAATANKDVENYSVPQIVGVRQKLHDLASQMSEETGETWTPREMQAAIWVYINSQQTGKDITKVASYQSGLNKPSQKYGGKSPLEWLNSVVPNLKEGPLSDIIGINGIEMAPTSALAKKRLLQLSKEGSLKLKPVKTVTDAQRYINAQKANKYAPVLTILSAKELAQSVKDGSRQVFITEDGQAGYAVQNDGDIQMVFSNSDKQGVGINLVAEAITAGGRKLDAFDGFLPDWYRKTFGFEEVDRDPFDPQYADPNWESDPVLKNRPDVVYMTLRPDAITLYSDKNGKVKPNLIRDNLNGFTGNYTRAVRYSNQAMESLNTMADLNSVEADREYLQSQDEQRSHVANIHRWRDSAALNIDRFAAQIEQEFLEKFGGRKSRVKGIGTGRWLHTAKSEVMAKAMNLYIDSGVDQAKRDKAFAFGRKLRVKGKNRTTGETEKLKVIDAMLDMSAGAENWAKENIRTKYDEFFQFAKKHDIIDSYVEDYVKRVWKMPKRYENAGITWDGAGTTGFKLTPSSGKQRTLSSIIDGWEAGLELNTSNVMANLQAYANEIGYVYANRRFVDYMRSLVGPSGESSLILVRDKAQNPPEGFVKLTTRGFAAPGKVVYARRDMGEMINKIGKRASDFWDKPLLKVTRRVNSMLKSTILSVTMFHHLAGLRSYVFGVRGTGLNRLRPFKAYRDGLKMIDKKTGFDSPNYQHLGPMVDLLVAEGLTLGRQQDWEEGSVMDSTIEEYLRKRKTPGAEMALHGWQGARRWKRQWTNGLFGQLFAGLKAQSAAVELTREIGKMEKKHGRGLTDAELKVEAEKVARLINADFGGLHLARMGRDPDMQRWAQLTMLAPDWTESNWRTVTGMLPGVNKAINKVIGDNPAPPGMKQVYRKFWMGIAWKGALSVVAAQWAVLALFGDDKDREEYMKQLSEATTREGFAKGRWASVDITPVMRAVGLEPPEGKRSDVNLLGHFKDIFKAVTPVTLAKHKVSPAVRLAESMATRTDWKGDRFRTVTEMIDHKSFALVADKYKDSREPEGWDAGLQQLLTAGIYNIRQSFPIPLSEMAQAWQGESSWMSAIGRAGGLDVRDVRHKDPAEQFYWKKSQEIKRLERGLDEAKQVRDHRMIFQARRDIKAYDNFNRTKSRLGFARTRLSPINKKIRALEAKLDRGQLTESELSKLRRLKQRKADIYKKFSEVVGR